MSFKVLRDPVTYGWWAMVLILIIAFFLRAPLLDGPRFHPDEALFASFARSIAVWRDPLLMDAPVDKPPLLFYLQALCYPFLGPREMAARIPNLISSIVTVALTFSLSKRMLSAFPEADRSQSNLFPFVGDNDSGLQWASLLAALILCCSPLAISFGASAFTDTTMVMWGIAALLSAVTDRPGWSGLWLGVSMATKYQAFFFVPLAVGLRYIFFNRGKKEGWHRMALAALGPILLVIVWDIAQSGRISLLANQYMGYGGIGLVSPSVWWSRLVDWLQPGRYILGSLPLTLLGGVVVLGAAFMGAKHSSNQKAVSVGNLLIGWLFFYALGHWLFNVQSWDRYLLPVVPVVAATIAWAIKQLGSRFFRHESIGLALTLLVAFALMLPNALEASRGNLPIGGDHGTYDGIDQVAEYFSGADYGTVLYDHWLNWELRYYLFDSHVYVSWFPDANSLVEDLRVFGACPARYLIFPAWESAQPLLDSIRAADFSVDLALRVLRSDGRTSFTVWQITTPCP